MNTSLAVIVAMSLIVISSSCVSAQDKSGQGNTPDFSGTWIMDTRRSKPDEEDRIETLKLTVRQTETEIQVDSALKLIPHDPAFMGGPMARPLEQNTSNSYRFDGKGTRGEVFGPGGPRPATLQAKLDSCILQLSQTHGDPVVISRETWKLSADGKILTVERVGGTGRVSTLVFSKKQ